MAVGRLQSPDGPIQSSRCFWREDSAAHFWYYYQDDMSTIPATKLAALKFHP